MKYLLRKMIRLDVKSNWLTAKYKHTTNFGICEDLFKQKRYRIMQNCPQVAPTSEISILSALTLYASTLSRAFLSRPETKNVNLD